MLKLENLTINQIARRLNMTRQGVRFHINSLERQDKIKRTGDYVGRKNTVYTVGGEV